MKSPVKLPRRKDISNGVYRKASNPIKKRATKNSVKRIDSINK
jgi:hypothetical protein